jgi:hypothetical protein
MPQIENKDRFSNKKKNNGKEILNKILRKYN